MIENPTGDGIPEVNFSMESLNPVQKRIVVALQHTKKKPELKEINFTRILLKVRESLRDDGRC